MSGDTERHGAWVAQFRERARKVRERAGVTQAELAKKAGLSSANSPNRLERGATGVVSFALLSQYLRLADSLGMSRAWMMGWPDQYLDGFRDGYTKATDRAGGEEA